MLTKLLNFFRAGSHTFNDAELRLLQFTLDALPASDKEILSQQIASVTLVQRQHPGRLVVAYYKKDPDKVPKLPYPGYEHCLANVSYKSKAQTKTTGLVLHDGKFMSFERNVPQQLADIESLVKVVLHPDGFKSVTDEIEAGENGDEPRRT